MEFRHESFLSVRQDGVRSWCFFATNGAQFTRSYGGMVGTGKANYSNTKDELGALEFLIREAILTSKLTKVDVPKPSSNRGAYDHYQYDLFALVEPAKVGDKFSDCIPESFSESVKGNVDHFYNSSNRQYTGYAFAERARRKKHAAPDAPRKVGDVEIRPMMLPGIGIYQTCIAGRKFDLAVFSKSVSRLARFCRANLGSEVRIDMPVVDGDTKVAVMAIFGTLPSNAVVVDDDRGEYHSSYDDEGSDGPLSSTGETINGLPVVRLSDNTLHTISSASSAFVEVSSGAYPVNVPRVIHFSKLPKSGSGPLSA